MPQHPDAHPVRLEAGPTGVLLVHGFTGSPVSMRPWAGALHEAGFTVSLPLLPGHGTTWQQMNDTTWADWYGAAERELVELSQRCSTVVVGGLSMGGALALRLAELMPERVAGLVLVNPAVKVEDPRLRLLPGLKRVVASLPGISNDIKKPGQDEGAYSRTPLRALHSQVNAWRDVVADLGRVTMPVLLLRSRVDHVVPASSSALILERIESHDVTEVVLEDSYHVATLDHDAPIIEARSVEFVQRIAGGHG